MLETIVHGEITELRLARPPVNALDPELVNLLSDAIAEQAEGAKALVLSGVPGMFSAGLDVRVLVTLDRPAIRRFWTSFFGLWHAIAGSRVPVAAAMTGHSPAGGTVLAIYSDYRVAAEGDFYLGLNEVQVGLPVVPVLCRAYERLLGARRAEQLLMAGKLVTPAEAHELGLVDELCPVEEVVPRALAWARSMIALPAAAQRATRRAARANLLTEFDRMDDALTERMTDVWFSEETRSTMQALVAKLAR